MSPIAGRKPEAAGCKITRDDTSLVFLSIICSCAYGLYGSCYSALAAAIPQLAVQLRVDSSDFGVAYTARGVGYLIGTLLSAYILKIPTLTLSKTIMSCFSLIFIAVTMFIIAFGTNYYLVLFVFAIQGLGFGGMDMMANCAVPDLWGLRAQPWMQLMHTMFSIGSIVGPFFVGYVGFRIAFVIIAFSCLTPLGLLFLGTIAGANQHRLKQKHQRLSSNEDTAAGGSTSIEMTSIHGGSAVLTLSDENEIRFDDDPEVGTNTVRNPLSSGSSSGDGTGNDGNQHPTIPLPSLVKWLTCAFYFIYMGYSLGFSAWITVYALDVKVTDNEADAAYLTSIYWFAMTLGRVAAIFVAIYLSATAMMRIKLVQCLIAAILLICISSNSYNSLMAGTIVFGYADSSIFPLGMTILTDYGFEMDESATTLFMVGTTMGEAVLPALFGFCMDGFGSLAFPWLVTACSIFLATVYLIVDRVSKSAVRNHIPLDQSSHSVSGGVADLSVHSKSSHGNNSGDSSPTGVGGVVTFSPLSGVDQEDDDLVQIEL